MGQLAALLTLTPAEAALIFRESRNSYAILGMNEFEIAYGAILPDSIVQALEQVKADGVFGKVEPFLVVWISDSDAEIIFESVRLLNPPAVVGEFNREFGSVRTV